MNLAKIVPLIADIRSLVAEIEADLSPESDGGKKLTREESRRVVRALVKAAGDLAALVL